MITVNTDYSRCPRTKPIARQIPKPIFEPEAEIHWVHKKPAALRAAGLLTHNESLIYLRVNVAEKDFTVLL